jgi:hypothetical protein
MRCHPTLHRTGRNVRSLQELTSEDVSNELCELQRLAGVVGPDIAWTELRRAVIHLDNHQRRIQRRYPGPFVDTPLVTWHTTPDFGHTTPDQIDPA